METPPAFWMAWTVRVNAVELLARLTTYDKVHHQFELIGKRSTGNPFNPLPNELLEPIRGEVEQRTFEIEKKLWTKRIRDLESNRHPVEGKNPSSTWGEPPQKSHRHKILKEFAKGLPVTSDAPKLKNLSGKTGGLRPIFLRARIKSSAEVSEKSTVHFERDTIEAYITLPALINKKTYMTQDYNPYWDNGVLYVAARSTPVKICQDAPVLEIFEAALKDLGLTALHDHLNMMEELTCRVSTFDIEERNEARCKLWMDWQCGKLQPTLRGMGTLTDEGWGTRNHFERHRDSIKAAGGYSWYGY